MAHIFTLQRTPRLIPGTTAFALGPRVPDGVEWGQIMDTLVGEDRRQVVLLHMDDRAAEDWAAKLLPGETYEGRALDDSTAARIKAAFAAASPDWTEAQQKLLDMDTAKKRGDSPQQIQTILRDYDRVAKAARDWHRGPLDEWHAAYRTQANAIEDAERARKVRAAARDIVRMIALVGINVGLAWACGVYGVALATVVTSDLFGGGDDADITGRTSDAGSGGSGYTWALGAGGASIVSAEVNLASGANTEFYLSDMPNTADVDVSVKYVSGNFGALARINGASGTGYMAWRSWSLYRNDGWGAWNEIATGASPVSSGNTLMCRCSGTTISRVNNGSVDGTTTSASYTTGKAGIACYGSTGIADDFLVDDTAAAATGNPWYYYAQQG